MTNEAQRFRKCAAELREIAIAANSKADRAEVERIADELDAEAARIDERSART